MKPLILCDLDGTLADISHRRHFIEIGECPECGNVPEITASCTYCKKTGIFKNKDWIPSIKLALMTPLS